MARSSIPRLYRKRCGTYFLRVIVDAATSSPAGTGRKRKEVRYSLRTKDSRRARAVAAWANARLEMARTMSDREDILNTLGADMRQMLTIGPRGISVENRQDVDNLLHILGAHPELPQALLCRQNPEADAIAEMMMEVINRAPVAPVAAQGAGRPAANPVASLPANPLRMSQAMEQYKAAGTSSKLALKTTFERDRLLMHLKNHVAASVQGADGDPYVHEIATHHLSTFLDTMSTKAATDGSATNEQAAARTVLKKISFLELFFEWAQLEREASLVDPTVGLARRVKALRKVAAQETEHYAPFDLEQLQLMFDPSRYLAFNNHADYFWAPLLGLHLGTRLKEVITLDLANIELHKPTGLWFMDVTPEKAKNPNSIRRLPIATRLVELGFIDYVERLRKLGATTLFPHRDLTSKTGRRDPSKNCSRRFGEYLDTVGIVDPALVFHSFRHTVVTSLQRARVPLPDAMEIAGHQAQDHAVRTGEITAAQARSVHIRTYTHADKPVLDKEYPLARLHQHLDNAIKVPLDYERLRRAASIVTDHVAKTSDGFKSGWSSLNRAHVEDAEARLNGA